MQLAALSLWATCAAASAIAFQTDAYDAGLFTPIETLSALSNSSYTALAHPAFPKHSVRVKKSKFCDGTVDAYTGYIDIEARHLFFYFFESRSNPDEDDVLFWTNGGPGAPSTMGLFWELGPCRATEPEGATYFEHAWNTNANIFFVDQPVGTGWSYADYGETVSTTEEAAVDIAAFVAVFFEHFVKFKGRKFHFAGESYGGRFLPLFGAAVYDQNKYLIEQGMTPVNLASVMIGNGMTEFSSMLLSYYDMACTAATIAPVVSISECVKMKQAIPRCEKWLKEACIDSWDAINCGAAYQVCQDLIDGPYQALGLNPYDITRPCDGELFSTVCYGSATKNIYNYLNTPSTRAQLNLDPYFDDKNFTGAAMPVYNAFAANLDGTRQTQLHLAALLERGVPVLIYVGMNDYICNWVGNLRFVDAMEWSGQQDFLEAPMDEWAIDGERIGLLKTSGNLTYLTVEGAGHMVPWDRPKEALEMVRRWLYEDNF
ncbi:serine carboxypeptidase [Cylindrobasidium torrendii FP15055 ss-10]|uniref:carboxypeptidase C n=1 Tax=Cylindrobasidium torrendii FP15055 ss-10 TaxID=1314674 RepID=A0A0D7B4E5_9AGAR|nr:serine carboxypeptidase [Cylindrobasidium torrendii FP15055 ss-10]